MMIPAGITYYVFFTVYTVPVQYAVPGYSSVLVPDIGLTILLKKKSVGVM